MSARTLLVCTLLDDVRAVRAGLIHRAESDSALTAVRVQHNTLPAVPAQPILPPVRVIPAQWYPNRAARRAAGYVRGAGRPGDMRAYREID